MAQLGTVEWFMEFYDIDRATAERRTKPRKCTRRKYKTRRIISAYLSRKFCASWHLRKTA